MFPAVRLGKTAVSTRPTSAQGVGEGIDVGDGEGGRIVSIIVGIGVFVSSSKGVGGGGRIACAACVGSGAAEAVQARRVRVVRKTAVYPQSPKTKPATDHRLLFTSYHGILLGGESIKR